MSKREIAVDAVGVVGLAVLVNGVRLIYPPAAWMLAGMLLVGIAILAARRNP